MLRVGVNLGLRALFLRRFPLRRVFASSEDPNSQKMDKVFSFFTDFGDVRIGGADSFCDRLNSRFTVLVLLIFAVMLAARHYVGEPISCWCPAHFTDSHVDFTNKVCWTTDTYYLPDTQLYLPKEGQHRKMGAKMVGYYQWVALILMCQACLFYLPRPIWRLFNKKSGIAVSTITDAAIEYQRKMDTDGRDKTMRYMVKHMGRYLMEMSRNRALSGTCRGLWFAFYGNYLIVLYIAVKILYIFNALMQVVLLNNFLGMDYHAYGIDVMKNMIKGERWTTSDRFPRVTFCDFKIRVLGNIQRYTVQCSLPMNLLNEIIFIFLWFWFAFVALATIGSLLMWLATSIYAPYQVKYVRSRLIAMDKLGNAPKALVGRFVKDYLRRDGTFIIRLVSKNASDIIAAELICGLWEYFKDNKKSLLVTPQFSKEEPHLMDNQEEPPDVEEAKSA